MILRRPREFFRRLGDSGLIGFGESYMAGDWDCAEGDLTGLLTVFAAHAAGLVPPWLQRLRRLAVRRPPAADDQKTSITPRIPPGFRRMWLSHGERTWSKFPSVRQSGAPAGDRCDVRL
jgi:hypothetical protein